MNREVTSLDHHITPSVFITILFFSSMADSDFDQNTTPSTPLQSLPLQLSGFLSGETIQLQGDTGDLQFSVQLNIHKKNPTTPNFTYTREDPPSYITPFTPREDEDPVLLRENHWSGDTDRDECGTVKREGILTRLRSGVISPVSYFPPRVKSWRKSELRMKKKDGRKRDGLERMFSRRSLPVKPCGSYNFFVMATWGSVKCSSFGETSKRLSQMWCKLGPTKKKLFEEMALKDSARYKRQSMLLMGEKRDNLLENWKMVTEAENEV